MHIAKIDMPAYYSRAFQSRGGASDFVRCVEDVPVEKSKAKIVLYQAARMLWLGEQIETIAKARPAFQVLFQLIAAELVAKLAYDFKGDGQSRKHVHLFFEEICSDGHRGVMTGLFRDPRGPAITLPGIVDLLYDIRCDVVHEGRYFTFTMPDERGGVPLVTIIGERHLIARAPICDLHQVVLEGAILGALRLLPEESPCRNLLKVA